MTRYTRALAVLVFCTSLHAERRWAFVAAVDDYATVPALQFATTDAGTVASALVESGFEVTTPYNKTLADWNRLWNDFLKKVQPDDIALVYFAGHGVQQGKVNYLLPSDFDEARGMAGAIRLDDLIQQLTARKPALKIFILDACRDNPLKAKDASGLDRAERPNTVLSYATAPDRVAKEQLFAPNLAKAMRMPGLALTDVFSAAAKGVEKDSNRAQIPFLVVSGSIPAHFYFTAPDRIQPMKDAREGRCEKAEAPLKELAVVYPNDGVLMISLAQCQARMKKISEARQSLDRAKTLRVNSWLVDTELARIAIGEQDFSEAKFSVNAALKAQPDYSPAILLKGTILIQEEHFHDAVDLLEGYRTDSREACELHAEALRLDGGTPTAARLKSACAAIR